MINEISGKDLQEHGYEICDQIICELIYEYKSPYKE